MSSTGDLSSGGAQRPPETLPGTPPGEGEPPPSGPAPEQDSCEDLLPSAPKGPGDSKAGATQDDIDLDNNVFGDLGYSSNPNSADIQNDPAFDSSVEALNKLLKTGSEGDFKAFQNSFNEMDASGDWLAMLFEVFKESKRDTLANQKYFLKRLEERNKINDAIQKYMRELVEDAQKLNKKVRGVSDSQKDKQTVRVIQKNFDVGPQAQATDEHGNLITPSPTKTERKSLGREDLNNLIKDVDMMSTRARIESNKIKGFFQGWQEKANQVDQQLTSILRIFKDLGRVGVGGSDLGAS